MRKSFDLALSQFRLRSCLCLFSFVPIVSFVSLPIGLIVSFCPFSEFKSKLEN